MIILAGMIGAGKSTYTEFIAKELGGQAFYESVEDNRILEKYYADPARWAFSLQIYFLNTRFRSIKQACTHPKNVLDRSIYEDALFTRINYENGNMSEAEMDLYLDLLDNMMEEVDGLPRKAPDLLIYLSGSLDVHLRRIQERGRPFEQIEDNPQLLAYYTQLHARYDEWFREYDKSPTLVIDIDRTDLDCDADRKWVLGQINQKLDMSGVE